MAVAELSFGPVQRPLILNACLKAQYTCPGRFVEGGLCQLISKADLNKLTNPKNREKLDQAEQMMLDARGLAQEAALPADKASQALGSIDTRCVLHLMGKGASSVDKKVFKSLGEIGAVRVL